MDKYKIYTEKVHISKIEHVISSPEHCGEHEGQIREHHLATSKCCIHMRPISYAHTLSKERGSCTSNLESPHTKLTFCKAKTVSGTHENVFLEQLTCAEGSIYFATVCGSAVAAQVKHATDYIYTRWTGKAKHFCWFRVQQVWRVCGVSKWAHK